MKKMSFAFAAIALISFILLCTGCSKEKDTPKEIMTRTLIDDICKDSLRAHVQWLEGMSTRFCLAANHRQVAVRIRNRFRSLGFAEAMLDSFKITGTFRSTYPYDQWQYNVVASIEGTVNPDSICIIGGHYDNILRSGSGDPFLSAYGANDNASGVAAVIEMARVMKLNNYAPRNTIMFIAFDAEELGLLGSYAWSNNAKENDARIKMMLNNDMIAFQTSADRSQWVVDIMNYPNSQDLKLKAQNMTTVYTDLGYADDNSYNKQSDSYPFSLNDYPAIFFFGYAPDPNYHTLNDVSSQCNFEFCREIVKVSCALLVDANTANN